jgi:hypothetical protein
MIHPRFFFSALFTCAVTVFVLGTAGRAAAQPFPFLQGGTLSCVASSCTVVGGPFNGGTGTFDSTTGNFSGNFGSCTIAGSVNTGSFTFSPGCSSSSSSTAILGRSAQQVSQVSIGAVRSLITSVRDALQGRKNSSPAALRYTWDDDSLEQGMNYTSGDVSQKPVFKAVPKTPMLRTLTYALWGQGFGDVEWRSGIFNGIDIGRTTTTVGGLGGADLTITNIFSATDAYVIGVLGGYTSARVRNSDGSTARIEGPGVGLYTIYVNGGFSTDSIFKVDFFDLNRSVAGLPDLGLHLTNYTSAYNVNYKFDMKPWWLEPTVGFSYTSTVWDGVTVEPTLTALAYSDVEIRGGTIAVVAGVPTAPTDEGKVFGLGIAKLNFIWDTHLSSYLEAEVRGRQGVLGAAGRVGLRYAF